MLAIISSTFFPSSISTAAPIFSLSLPLLHLTPPPALFHCSISIVGCGSISLIPLPSLPHSRLPHHLDILTLYNCILGLMCIYSKKFILFILKL